MPIFTRKDTQVEARQHAGPDLNVTSFRKGDQIAKTGDFLVVDALAVANIRAEEKALGLEPGALGNKGVVYVIPKAEFLAAFNASDDSVVPEIKGEEELSFETILPEHVAEPVAQ